MNRTNPDTTDIFGSSLLPAVVPKIGDYPVVSEQPQPARTSPPAKFLTVEANVGKTIDVGRPNTLLMFHIIIII